jgi:hypothetical protein
MLTLKDVPGNLFVQFYTIITPEEMIFSILIGFKKRYIVYNIPFTDFTPTERGMSYEITEPGKNSSADP